MTHDNLLALIAPMTNNDAIFMKDALLAVVDLHKPICSEYFTNPVCQMCTADIDYYVEYPCPTIVAIEISLE